MSEKKQRKPRNRTWLQQSVCFLVADSYHNIKPVSITMPVRIKQITEDATIYEGPINTMWETKVSPRINDSEVSKALPIYQYDLVGVLVACLNDLDRGKIGWLEQSEEASSEAGADRIKQTAKEEA